MSTLKGTEVVPAVVATEGAEIREGGAGGIVAMEGETAEGKYCWTGPPAFSGNWYGLNQE